MGLPLGLGTWLHNENSVEPFDKTNASTSHLGSISEHLDDVRFDISWADLGVVVLDYLTLSVHQELGEVPWNLGSLAGLLVM